MKRFFLDSLILIGLLMLSFLFGLNYVESSNGLEYPRMESGRTEVEMVDINNDGNIDIISIGDHGSPYVNTEEHGVMVWFGDGQGNWTVYQNGEFGYGGIAVGDVNNDGFLDIGYGMHHAYSPNDFGDSILEVALGDGTGQNWIPWDDGISIGDTIFPINWGMFGCDFADIDNDGDLDLGANSFGANDGIHIFINHGDGTWHQTFGFLGGNSTNDFLFGDVNNDGYCDFCAAHQYGSIYLNDGNGGFVLADGNLPPPGARGRRGPSLGDVDNDGDLDFAFANDNGGVEVWGWQGNNTWLPLSTNLPTTGPYTLTQLWDMNLDGFIDLCAFGESTVTVWLGNGQGVWQEATTFYTAGPGRANAFRVGADADHNGYPDMVLVSYERSGTNNFNRPRFYKETTTPESLFIFPIFPRGGQRFYSGSIQFIKWCCGVPQGNARIKIELSTNGPNGPWLLIADSLKNNGCYQWRIPTTISNSNDCYLRFTAITEYDTTIILTPQAFTIISQAEMKEEKETKNLPNFFLKPTFFVDLIFIKLKTSSGISQVNIYNYEGKLIKNLFTIKGSGEFNIYWDKKDEKGNFVSPGSYFLKLENQKITITKKIVITK